MEAVADGRVAEHRHVSYLALLETAEEARGYGG
jgi:hypothetical protein